MNQIREIAKKFIAGKASLAEKKLLHQWYDEQIIADEDEIVYLLFDEDAADVRQRLYQTLLAQIAAQESDDIIPVLPRKNSVNTTSLRRIASIAAVASIVVSIISYLYYLSPKDEVLPPVNGYAADQVVNEDVSPGGNKALLKLDNGLEIPLAQADDGFLAQESGVNISKTNGGILVYHVINGQQIFADHQPAYHVLTTPKSGQYQIILPDRTKVWLNAASSLKYPAKFAYDKREVELEGEAYFEVANVFHSVKNLSSVTESHNNKYRVPFIVKTKNQQVEVTGTEFNINAYEDEYTVRTTLVEGGVRVIASFPSLESAGEAKSLEKTLQPGEQAIVANNRLDVAKVNIENESSWKDGNFLFDDLSLHTIMRQLSRWYDVDVDYDKLPQTRYNGFISRNVPLSRVLDMFEKTGNVRFTITNRTIKVNPEN